MASTELITIEQVEDVLLHGGKLAVADPEAVQEDMVQRILASETLEEAFAAFESTPVKDIEGVLVDVVGIAWMRSSFPEGPQVYALCKCVLVESKAQVTVSMGGRTTMARFCWAMRQEAMPIRGVFEYEDSAQDNGRRYLTFKLAPRSAK